MSRLATIPALAVGLVLLTAAQGAPPEAPVRFVSVDELKAMLDRGTRVDIIDVRTWDAYVRSHIKGARSMPLRVVAERAREITKTGPVVFY
jgi:3-mercaptopyruvate sulfurtransferase SseA